MRQPSKCNFASSYAIQEAEIINLCCSYAQNVCLKLCYFFQLRTLYVEGIRVYFSFPNKVLCIKIYGTRHMLSGHYHDGIDAAISCLFQSLCV